MAADDHSPAKTLTVGCFTGLGDLLLLRLTDCIIGTQGSSFSVMAAFGRPVPAIACRSANPLLQLWPLWLWARGEVRKDVVRRYFGRLLRQWLP